MVALFAFTHYRARWEPKLARMRGKASYNKPLSFSEKVLAKLPDAPDLFTTKFKDQIRNILNAKGVRLKGQAADLIAEVISEGRWARGELEGIEQQLKKRDALAEIDDLISVMIKKSWALRKISLSVEEVLKAEAEPLRLADDIDRFVSCLRATRKSLTGQKIGRLSSREKVREVSDELALRIIRLARTYGLKVKAAGQAGDVASFSVAVRLLRLVGAKAGIKYEISTWRNILGKAKRGEAITH